MNNLLCPSVDMDKLKGVLFKYFVQFYGEKHAEYIKYKLDNCFEVILYNSVDDVDRLLSEYDRKKKSELTIEFLRKNDIEIPDDMATQIIENNSTYLLKDVLGARDLIMLYFSSNSYGDNENCGFRLCFMNDDNNNWINISRQNFLKALGAKCDGMDPMEFLKSDEGRVYFEIIEKQKQTISELDEKYQEFRKPYERYYPIIDNFVSVKRQIMNKYSLQFLSSISEFLTDRDKNMINNYMPNNDYDTFNRNMFNLDCYGSLFKYLHSSCSVEAFSTDASLKLESTEVSAFSKKVIIDDRMEYFRIVGLNPDDKSYEELISSLDPKEIPDCVFVDKLINEREKYLAMANYECASLAINYDEVLNKASAFGLTYELGLGVLDLMSSSQFMAPNVRKDTGEVVGVVCYSPLKDPKGYSDVKFIHEVNHMLDLRLVGLENGEALYKVGFSYYNNGDDEITDYEVSNETVNHLIAMDITKLMHEDGVYIFDDCKHAKIRGSVSYEHNNIILGNFYQTFKQDILDGRLSTDLSSMIDVVGEDNFKELNGVAKRYNELPYYNLMDDINREKDTPLRKEGLSLIRQASDITESMKSYRTDASYGIK